MQVFATSEAAVYTGVGNAFTRISATEGARALWRGVSSVILGAGPAHAVHFGMYEFMKENMGGNVLGRNNWLETCEFAPRIRLSSYIRESSMSPLCLPDLHLYPFSVVHDCKAVLIISAPSRSSCRCLRHDCERCSNESVRW